MLNKDIIYKSQLNLDRGDKYVLRQGWLTHSLNPGGQNQDDLATPFRIVQ